LLATWDGTAWSYQKIDQSSTVNYALYCASATSCSVATITPTTTHDAIELFTQTGSTWRHRLISLPAISGNITPEGGDVAADLLFTCANAGHCIAAVGYGATVTKNGKTTHVARTLISTGSLTGKWTIQSVTLPISLGTQIVQVSCGETGLCAVVGDSGDTAIVASGKTGHWQTQVDAPMSAHVFQQLAGVSCSATACVAVGAQWSVSSAGQTTALPLILRG
jgi:hypothetical protein